MPKGPAIRRAFLVPESPTLRNLIAQFIEERVFEIGARGGDQQLKLKQRNVGEARIAPQSSDNFGKRGSGDFEC